MKKYLVIFGVLAVAACNAKRADDSANRENEIRQRTIDSIDAVNSSQNHHSNVTNNYYSSPGNNTVHENTSAEPVKKKGMSNTTKGALIGTGAGIATGAATGAAVSKDKGKGAIIGGVVGGAVGSGVGYGVGAHKDKKEKDARESGQ